MKVQIISDIHLDYNELSDFDYFIIPSADILLILGDISSLHINIYDKFLDFCSNNWKYIIFISGNHEYYTPSSNPKTFKEIDLHINEITKKYTNIYYLNRDYVEIEGYVFLGTTLWSNVNTKDAQDMNDYNLCYYNQENNGRRYKLNTSNVRKEYKDNVAWLKNKVKDFKDKKIIILTHHVPFLYNYHDDKNPNTAYCSDLIKDFTEYKNINYWFCGHSHEKIEYRLEHIKVISNPLGYISHENTNNLDEIKKCIIDI